MESAEQAHIECPSCHAAYHQESRDLPGKHEMNREHARWVKDGMIWTPDKTLVGDPFRSDISSFWLKGPAATFADFSTLVNNYLAAEEEYEQTGSEEALKTTVNVDQGSPYVPKAEANARLPENIKATARDYGIRMVPPGVRFLVACIDLQKNRFEVQVHGFGTDENGLPDIWVIDRFKIRKSRRVDEDGDRAWVNIGAHPEDWKQLTDEVMLKTYPLLDGSGRHMSIKLTVSDSAGSENFTANAYDFVRWLKKDPSVWRDGEEEDDTYVWKDGLAGRFHLLRGSTKKEVPRVRLTYPDSERKDRHAGARGEIPVYEINTQHLKDNIDKMLDRKVPGGRVNFPDWLDDNFFTELTVEVKDPVKGWHNPKRFRNESWDLLVYAKAASLMSQINIDNINWTDPPGWAADWDENDLVFNPEMDDKPFEAEQPDVDLAALAQQLA
jgi:phage terminase large subunit GpA-like protein